jgi:WD40 repeat protein
MAISHNGRFLAAAGGLGTGALSLWDLGSGQPLKSASLAASREPIAFAPDRVVLAAQATNPAVSLGLVDLNSDVPLSAIPVGGARSLAFSADGRLVAIGDDDETVTVWEVWTGRAVVTFSGHRHRPDPMGDGVRSLMADFGLADRRVQNTVWSVAFSPDGTKLASSAQDGAVWLWGLPGLDAIRPPNRALLPRPNSPGWLPVLQVILALTALALFATALRARETSR